MRILYVNSDGGGFADYIQVAPGAPVEQLFAERLPGHTPADYLIRLNRLPVAAGHILKATGSPSTPSRSKGRSPPVVCSG